MKPLKKILAVADPTSDAQPAVERAGQLARLYKADVELYIACYYSTLTDIAADQQPAVEKVSEAMLARFEENLEQLADGLRRDGVSVSTRAEWRRSLHKSIIEEAERCGADLIVKDTHYHTAIERALFTNTDWSLIRESDVPIWLVRSGNELGGAPTLMACVELTGSEDEPDSMDDNVIEAGRELARVLKGRLVVFHAFDPMTAIGHAATWAVKPELLPGDALRREMRDARSDVLDRFAGRHGLPADQRLLKSGSVRSTLPGTVTELHAAVTILGAVGGRDGRNGRGRIGSTAESVMDHIAGDLLVLQPGG